MTTQTRTRNQDGSAYGRAQQHPDDELIQVGPGTPMGELFRRYWLPVGTAADAHTRPTAVRVLGEDLVLFRDRKGRAGLLYPRCMHRGTSLFYGKVEEEGIRCCYHGWLFGVDGTCHDQPCEPNHGDPEQGGHRDLARQPWYPVEERYGLIFAYMGPPEKKPVLPRFDILEDCTAEETVIGQQGGAQTGDRSMPVAPYSWVHLNDNVMDPYHVWVLHSTFTEHQFAAEFEVKPEKVDFFTAEQGVCYSAVRTLDDGRNVDRISSFMMPAIMSVPNTQMLEGRSNRIAWITPIDDSHFTTFNAGKVPKGETTLFRNLLFHGKEWNQMTLEEHQDWPGDFEAQAGQGAISLHSEEHLATSDRGIVMMRRMLKENMKLVQEGGDPLGVAFDDSKATVHVRSGNFFKKQQAAE